MSIFRTFSSGARRPFFVPPVQGVNGSNYWQKIDQLPSPMGGHYALWMNANGTEVYLSGLTIGGTFYNLVGFYSKPYGQWNQYDPNPNLISLGHGTFGGEATSKNGLRIVGTRALYYGGFEFIVIEKQNEIWTISGAFNGDSLATNPVFSISSNGNAVLHRVNISGGNYKYTYLMKFENSQWVQKLYYFNLSGFPSQFPDYQYLTHALNANGSRFVLAGYNPNNSICNASIFQETVNQNGTSTYSQLGSQITFQTAGRLTRVWLNDDGTRVAAQIAITGYYDDFYYEVWEFNGTSWGMLGNRIGSNATSNTILGGRWFSYDGTVVFVRQQYSVKAFKFNGTAWVEVGAPIPGPSSSNFGKRVWTNDNGTRVIVSGGLSPSEGVAEIYQYIS